MLKGGTLIAAVEAFITRWQGHEGGQERANYALFITELCDLLGVERPKPAAATSEQNDYVFERSVREAGRDGSVSSKRIDLYKKDCFVLEAKQSRFAGQKKLAEQPAAVDPNRGRRGANRAWDVLMLNARIQAENYVRLLPQTHQPPPFILVCDVGHCIEVYANFRRDGKAYDQFPDRRLFRVYLEDLRQEDVRVRLRAIWSEPLSLDPTRHSVKVTREIATRVAKVSKALENTGHPTEEVAMFLMRVLFTMFAEDVGLLPKDCFKQLLQECAQRPEIFPSMLEDLWRAMDEGGFSASIRTTVRRFNGEFFKNRRALSMAKEEIGELAAAARYDWKDVQPAIFGTFLEQALDPSDRRKLGAHYTPRAYVERLVIATIIDPLQSEWGRVLSTVERQKAEARNDAAVKTVQSFHDKLCETRVLDPACGTGNFLYVALELMKKLEGEVLEVLSNLGGQEALTGLESHTVDPHQFLGMEVNARAAAIAELVLWIGHLQWHFRNKGSAPAEPVLRAFKNIQTVDAVMRWEGYPAVPGLNQEYANAQRPDWPQADYIVGNPPFIGGKDIRARMGGAYAEALWRAHKHMNESADFVMYWWDRAAETLLKPKSRLKRFGFVTTNSISQLFQRRVMEPHLNAKKPLSIVMAIPDHPWTKVTRDSAAVRIAMTVAESGKCDGRLWEVTEEDAVDTDSPVIQFREKCGIINSDLTVGVDVTVAKELKSNLAISSPGVKLHGSGFIVTHEEAVHLGLGRVPSLDRHIRTYRNGRDLTSHPRGAMVIDLFGLSAEEVRNRFPSVYQHLQVTVKIAREKLVADSLSPSKDSISYAEKWWLFGKPRSELRPALANLPRYIATVETAKHRIFQFLDATILPDNKLINFALSDGYSLGVLQSRVHHVWYVANSAKIGMYEGDAVYVKSRCFDPFPFPAASETQKLVIGKIANDLDSLRKRVLSDHRHLTLTGLYNVLDQVKAGVKYNDLGEKDRIIFDDGLIGVLKEMHDELDSAVNNVYGWSIELGEEDILAQLVALNKERSNEEKRGFIRWLRPDYQIPLFGSEKEKATQLEADLGLPNVITKTIKPSFPVDDIAQTGLVITTLIQAGGALNANELASRFKQGQKVQPMIANVLVSLHRVGLVSSGDGGMTFEYRLAA